MACSGCRAAISGVGCYFGSRLLFREYGGHDVFHGVCCDTLCMSLYVGYISLYIAYHTTHICLYEYM